MRASSGDDGGHFLGSFVYVEGNAGPAFGSWLVIDGQQRLTTVTLLLIALRDHIRDTNWVGDDPTPDKIDSYFLKNALEQGDRHYKLALRRYDNDTLRTLIDGNDPDELEKSSESVLEAYNYFRDRMQCSNTDPEKIYSGIGRLSIVDVKLERHIDNPQLVFESLNSTGVDLTQSDLVRNYLLMGLPEEEQTRLYNDYWSKLETFFRSVGSTPDLFLRDYMVLKQKTNTPARADRIYTEFKEFWRPSGPQSLDSLLEDMIRFARYYVSFLGPERIDSKALASAMRQVRPLGTAPALLIMRLFESYEEGKLSRRDFIRALSIIASYIVRRAVLNIQIRDYWAVFARVTHEINDDSPFESFQVALARQSHRFPSDEEFLQEIQKRDLYSLRSCLYILRQLENAGQGEPSPIDQYSIEHIMPQSIDDVPEWQQMLGDDWESIHDSWLHRLGNLTLTAYNSTYSNRPFDDKKTIEGGFNQSAVRLNENVRNQLAWTVAQMEERGSVLAERAITIWPHHKADEKLIQEAKVQELRDKEDRQDFETLEMSEHVRELLESVNESISEMGNSIHNIENRSVCHYDYAANFFLEMLPMKHYIRLFLPIEFDEVDDPQGAAIDVTTRFKRLPNVVHKDCGVYIEIRDEQQIASVMPIIRQAFNMVTQR